MFSLRVSRGTCLVFPSIHFDLAYQGGLVLFRTIPHTVDVMAILPSIFRITGVTIAEKSINRP